MWVFRTGTDASAAVDLCVLFHIRSRPLINARLTRSHLHCRRLCAETLKNNKIIIIVKRCYNNVCATKRMIFRPFVTNVRNNNTRYINCGRPPERGRRRAAVVALCTTRPVTSSRSRLTKESRKRYPLICLNVFGTPKRRAAGARFVGSFQP